MIEDTLSYANMTGPVAARSFARRCPRCGKLWGNRRTWLDETYRVVGHQRDDLTIVEREHRNCGGGMYDVGWLTLTQPTILEVPRGL